MTADPFVRELRWFALHASGYEETATSNVLNVAVANLGTRIDWPG